MRRPPPFRLLASLLTLHLLAAAGCGPPMSHTPGPGSGGADGAVQGDAALLDLGPRARPDLGSSGDLAAADVGPSDSGAGADAGRASDGAPRTDLAADSSPSDVAPPDAAVPIDLARLDGGGPIDLARPDSGAPIDDLHVVLVIIDGARYSESMGAPDRAGVPHMAALAERGCAAGPITNVGTTTTAYSVGMILTGVTDAWGTSPEVPQGGYSAPTVWEYYRRQRGAAADDAWYVLKYISAASRWTQSHHADYGPDYWGSVRSRGRTDDDATDELIDVLQGGAPHLAVLYLADVDGAGHSGDWDHYLSTLRRADAAVGRLWDAIEAHPRLGGRTVLMVTNDHGRHDDEHGGFEGHGCGCQGCRQVMLLAVGPGVDPDCQPDHPYTTLDVTPTVGRLLGFDPDFDEGHPMEGVFVPGFLDARAVHQP